MPKGDTGATGAAGTPPAFSGARVYGSVNQSIANDTNTALSFDTERYDTDGYHESVTHPTRLTAPTTAKYLIGINVKMTGDAGGSERDVYLMVNATDFIAYDVELPSAANQYFSIMTEWAMTAGDYVETYVYQDSGSPLDVEQSDKFSYEMWIERRG